MDEAMRASIELERALEAGDLDAARRALGDPAGWPDVVDPFLFDSVLGKALGCAPLAAIEALLAQGADPNFHPRDDGFPSLIDVLHHRRDDRPELRPWRDRHEVLRALLAAGADVRVRGLNDWTALHFACADGDAVSARMLLEAGADPHARTRIDELETPLEIAEHVRGEVLQVVLDYCSR